MAAAKRDPGEDQGQGRDPEVERGDPVALRIDLPPHVPRQFPEAIPREGQKGLQHRERMDRPGGSRACAQVEALRAHRELRRRYPLGTSEPEAQRQAQRRPCEHAAWLRGGGIRSGQERPQYEGSEDDDGHHHHFGRRSQELRRRHEREAGGASGSRAVGDTHRRPHDPRYPGGSAQVVVERDQGEHGSGREVDGAGDESAVWGESQAASQHAHTHPGQGQVSGRQEGVIGPGGHEEIEPGGGVEGLRVGVGEERLAEGTAGVPSGPGAAADGAHEGLHLRPPDQVDVALEENPAFEDHRAEQPRHQAEDAQRRPSPCRAETGESNVPLPPGPPSCRR